MDVIVVQGGDVIIQDVDVIIIQDGHFIVQDVDVIIKQDVDVIVQAVDDHQLSRVIDLHILFLFCSAFQQYVDCILDHSA